MEIVFAVLLGVLIGIAVSHRRSVGYLRVDCSDPDSAPYLFIELNVPIARLLRSKTVRVKIKREDFLPHE